MGAIMATACWPLAGAYVNDCVRAVGERDGCGVVRPSRHRNIDESVWSLHDVSDGVVDARVLRPSTEWAPVRHRRHVQVVPASGHIPYDISSPRSQVRSHTISLRPDDGPEGQSLALGAVPGLVAQTL